MTEDNLKACPFCGSSAEIKDSGSHKTLVEALLSNNPSIICSNHKCCAAYIYCDLREWQSRPTPPIGIKWPDKFYHIGDEIIDGWIDKFNERIDLCNKALSQAHLSRGVDSGDIDELLEYFDQRADADDGRPNEEMKMLGIVQALAAKINKGEVFK